MTNTTIKRKDRALAEMSVEKLTPQPDPPADYATHKIFINVFGQRFELTQHLEVREIKRGPAEVITMPSRPVIEP